jgi:ribosomal protein L28
MHQGLWGGEGIVKGYYESKPYTRKKILPRNWIPKLWFPEIMDQIVYSEVLDKYFKIVVTLRALRLIDEAHGLDFYLLTTPENDVGPHFY